MYYRITYILSGKEQTTEIFAETKPEARLEFQYSHIYDKIVSVEETYKVKK
jgi:hypothetical protein